MLSSHSTASKPADNFVKSSHKPGFHKENLHHSFYPFSSARCETPFWEHDIKNSQIYETSLLPSHKAFQPKWFFIAPSVKTSKLKQSAWTHQHPGSDSHQIYEGAACFCRGGCGDLLGHLGPALPSFLWALLQLLKGHRSGFNSVSIHMSCTGVPFHCGLCRASEQTSVTATDMHPWF